MRVITVRNVPEGLYAELTRQAARERRSLQQHVLLILERGRALSEGESALEAAARIRSRLRGRALGDSVAELRAERAR